MKQVEHTNSEREMLVRVRHPFLVNLWGTFADPRNLYMVMDFVAGGELFSLLRKSQVSLRASSLLLSRFILRRLTGAVAFCLGFASASPTLSRSSTRPKSRSRSTTFTRSTSSTATLSLKTSSSERTDTSKSPTLGLPSMCRTLRGLFAVRRIIWRRRLCRVRGTTRVLIGTLWGC